MLKFKSNTVNGISVELYLKNCVESLFGKFDIHEITSEELNINLINLFEEVLVDTDTLTYYIALYPDNTAKLIPNNQDTIDLFSILDQY